MGETPRTIKMSTDTGIYKCTQLYKYTGMVWMV